MRLLRIKLDRLSKADTDSGYLVSRPGRMRAYFCGVRIPLRLAARIIGWNLS